MKSENNSNIKTLVMDVGAINILSYANIKSAWLKDFEMPTLPKENVKRVNINNNIYLLSDKADCNSSLLIINLDDGNFFSTLDDKCRLTAFDRILIVGLSYLHSHVSIPSSWGKFVRGNKLSIYTSNPKFGNGRRIYFEVNALDTNHVYAFALTEDNQDINEIPENEEAFISAFSDYENALKYEEALPQQDHASDIFSIQLTEPINYFFNDKSGLTLWLEKQLTKEQKDFVEKDYSGPVRLRGAAGTGKTLSLAVKFLNDIYNFEAQKKDSRLIFITHSWSTAEHVNSIIDSLDEKHILGRLKHVKFKVGSIYDLAQELLNYNLKNLQPLSTDGKEGRQYQFELISSEVKSLLKEVKFFTNDLKKCSPDFQKYITNESLRENFVWEIMNEFACIIDAESIRLGTEAAESYLRSTRERWQMNLETKEDRLTVLTLHDRYRKQLQEMSVLSMDQMVADFNRYLQTHEWEHLRKNQGYDAIFVDELHFFTKPERMVFHSIYRGTQSSIPMFMAYDIKQSVNDGYVNSFNYISGSSLITSTNVGKTKLVELTKVFRYTQEIADFLNDIDGAFPALDLASEWSNLNLESDKKTGQRPLLKLFPTDIKLIDSIFEEASREARRDKTKMVAVLCLNHDLFTKYISLGRIKKYHIPIDSRDKINDIKKSNGKCIFSMPEYIAGLQFNSVYLIHLDEVELNNRDKNIGIYRRFISQVYLGASRAENKLCIASSKERGGYSHILVGPIRNNRLILEDIS